MRNSRQNLIESAIEHSAKKVAAHSRRHQPLIHDLEPRILMSTYHVNTLDDNVTPGGTQTLREAVALANAHPNSTIILDKTGTYNLTDSEVDGDTDLDITASVTISSLSGKASNTFIDGNFNDRVFDIGGPTTIANVTFNNITIQNGLVDGDGGGIRVADDSGTALTLNGVVVQCNSASGDGGGVYAGAFNTVYITSSTVYNNIAGGEGGGLAYFGNTLTVYKSNILNNQAGLDGGGIFMVDVTFSLNPSMKLAWDNIMNNNADERGGGVFFVEGEFFLQPMVTTAISTQPVLPVATVKLVGICFNLNTSGWEGGGMYVAELPIEPIDAPDAVTPDINIGLIGFTPISLSVSNSQFTQNFGSDGGGLFCGDVDCISIDTSSFTGNSGSFDGGGLTVSDQEQIRGFGLFDNPNNTVKITTSNFTGNTAGEGGGIYIYSATCVVIDHTTVSNNRATYSGGGIFYEYDYSEDLGAITTGVSFTLTNDVINGNIGGGFGDAGGGVFFNVEESTGPVKATITNTKVTNNRMGGEGGGLFLNDEDDSQVFTVLMSLDTISGNSAAGVGNDIFGVGESGEGGGLFVSDAANSLNTITITKSTFASNRASQAGGGLYISVGDGEADITASTFNSNTSATSGGGIATGSSLGVINLINDTIAGNAAAVDGGGIFADNANLLNLVYDTIALNKAAFGGGVFNNGGVVSVLDTIIATNLLTGGVPANGPDVNGTFVDLGHNLIGASDGSTSFTTSTLVGTNASKKNPALKPLASNGGPTQTMAILKGSIADNQALPVIGITTDQRGVLRSTTTPAIGAFEV